MATTTGVADGSFAVAPATPRRDGVGTRIVRALSHAPLTILLLVVGVMWLLPTLGLFFTSLIVPTQISEVGWWHVFTDPALMTLATNEGFAGFSLRVEGVELLLKALF